MLCSIVACGRQTESALTGQEKLKEVAERFRVASPSQRCDLAEEISRLLPKCPRRVVRDNGISLIVVYDYSHPTYRLRRTDVERLFGIPESSTADEVSYLLARDRTGQRSWHLLIMLHDDSVFASTIQTVFDQSAGKWLESK